MGNAPSAAPSAVDVGGEDGRRTAASSATSAHSAAQPSSSTLGSQRGHSYPSSSHPSSSAALQLSSSALLARSTADDAALQCPASWFIDEQLIIPPFNPDALPTQLQDLLPEDVSGVMGPSTTDPFKSPAFPLPSADGATAVEPSSPQSPPPITSSSPSSSSSSSSFSTSSSSAAPSPSPPRVLDGPLSRHLVNSIGSLAHDPAVGGRAVVAIESHLASAQQKLRRLHDAIIRETQRERDRQRPRDTVDPSSPIPDTPLPPSLPQPAAEALPPISRFSVISACTLIVDLCTEATTALRDAQRLAGLLDVWAEVLKEEGLLSLGHGSCPLHQELVEALQPLFDFLHAALYLHADDADDAVGSPSSKVYALAVVERAADLLLSLSLARGSLSHLFDVLSLLHTRQTQSVSRPLLLTIAQHYHLPASSLYACDEKAARLQGEQAMALLLSQLSALADRICPLSASHLPLSSSSSSTGNANNAPLLYHPLCFQLTPSVLSQLSSLLVHYTVHAPRVANDGAARDSLVTSLVRLLIVHFQQLVLRGPASFSSYQSCLFLYPYLLSLLHSPSPTAPSIPQDAARLIAFSFPFFFPSLAEQLHQLHRLLLDWAEAESTLSSPTVMKASFNFSQELDEKDRADDSRASSRASSQRSSLFLSPPPPHSQWTQWQQQQQQGSPTHAGNGGQADIEGSLTITPSSTSLLAPRDPLQLYLTRLLLLRYRCFTGALLIVDALYEGPSPVGESVATVLAAASSASIARDSAAQLLKDLLTVVQFELKQRMRWEQSAVLVQTPRMTDGSPRFHRRRHSSVALTLTEPQVVEEELSLLLDLCVDLLEAVQTQLLSRQAQLFERQDQEEAERRVQQQRRQTENDEEEVVEEPLPTSTPALSTDASSKSESLTSVSPPVSRAGSLIMPAASTPSDYAVYYASSLLLSASSLMAVAYDVHRYALSSGQTPSSSFTSSAALPSHVLSSSGYQHLLRYIRRLAVPLVVVTSGFVSPTRPTFAASLLSSLTSFVEQLTRLNRLGHFLSQQEVADLHLDSDLAVPNNDAPLKSATTVESLHPYRPFTDQYVVLTLPPHPLPAHTLPTSVTLTFEPQLCATANAYDYVQLFSLHPFYSTHFTRSQAFTTTLDDGGADKHSVPLHDRSLSPRFHGNALHASSTFPTSPLTFTSQHVVLHFHAGTSYRATQPVTDSACHFGFAVRVEASFLSSAVSPSLDSPLWLSDLVHLSTHLAASLCAALIKGTPTGESELTADHWLHTSMFSGGFDREAADEAGLLLAQLPSSTASEQRQRHTQFLHELQQYDASSFSASSDSSAARLMAKLKKAAVDRQVVQRSIASVAQSVAQCVFAVLLKQADRVEDAIVCAERPDQRLDANIVRMWKKAAEIKLDVRSQYDSTQEVLPLVADIRRRLDFLLSLHSVHAQLEQISKEQREAGGSAAATQGRLSFSEGLRRQSSFTSTSLVTSPPPAGHPTLVTHLSSPAVLDHARAPSVDIDELARRSGRPAFHSRQPSSSGSGRSRGSGAMLNSTVRAMRMLKSLMKLRTRAVDSSADSEDPIDSVASMVFEFVREKASTGRLLAALSVALHQQRQRAENRVLGLQAVRQLCTKVLLLRGQGDLSTLSTPASTSHHPARTSSLTFSSAFPVRARDDPLRLCEMFLTLASRGLRSPPGSLSPCPPLASSASSASSFTSTPSLHVLSSVDSVGLELKSLIFNEFFAFLSLFFELSRDAQPVQDAVTANPDTAVMSLSPTSRLHLLHLCATDLFEDEHDDEQSAASPFFTRTHDLLALSRLGILSFLRPIASLLPPSAPSPYSLTPLTSLPWSVAYSAWSMSRLLLYAATDAVSKPGEADEGAVELHSTLLDFVTEQLQRNRHAVEDAEQERGRQAVAAAALPLSFSESSVATHLHRAQRIRLLEQATSSSSSSSTSSASLSSLSPQPSSDEVDDSSCQLLWALLRCCQSSVTRQRLAHSLPLFPLLLHLLFPSSSPSSSPSTLPPPPSDQPLGAAALSRLLAIRILRHLLPLVNPASPLMQHVDPHTGQSLPLLPFLLDHISDVALAPIRAILPPRTTASPPSPTAAIVSPQVDLLLASELVFLLRSLHSSPLWADLLNALLERHLHQLKAVHLQDLPHLAITPASAAGDEEWDSPTHADATSVLTIAPPPSLPLAVLGRVLACLWVLGGGPTVIGEGARVSVVIDDQFRTGTIIRTLRQSPLTSVSDQGSEGAVEALYEVLVDESNSPDDLVQDENSQQPAQSSERERDKKKGGHSRRNTASFPSSFQPPSAAPSAPGSTSSPAQPSSAYHASVYTFYASSLTALDSVPAPLLSLSPAAAAGIIQAIGAYLRRMDRGETARTAARGQGESGVRARIEHRFEQVKQQQREDAEEMSPIQGQPVQPLSHTAADAGWAAGGKLEKDAQSHPSKDAVLSASAPPAAVSTSTSSAVSLFWQELSSRALKALNVLLLREDIAALVLHNNLGPLLVPLALTDLSQLHLSGKGGAKAADPSMSSADWSLEQLGEGDDVERGLVRLTELEARALEFSCLLVVRGAETESAREERRRLWAAEDERRAAEELRLEQQRRADAEKERLERINQTPILLVQDPRHPPHPLLYHPRPPAFDSRSRCNACGSREGGPVYHCGQRGQCDYTLCMRCIEPTVAPLRPAAAAAALRSAAAASSSSTAPAPSLFPPTLEHPSHPQHTLMYSLTVYQGPFSCDSCCKDKNGPAYHDDICRWDICIACTVPELQLWQRRAQHDDGDEKATAAPAADVAAAEEKSAAAPPLSLPEGVEVMRSLSASEKSHAWAAELALLGFPLFKCNRTANAASSPSAAISALLDEMDSTAPDLQWLMTGGGWAVTGAWQLVPSSYWPPSLKMAEGMDKIRCFMDSYTERSSDLDSGSGAGIGSDLDLLDTQPHRPQRHSSGELQAGAAAHAASNEPKKDKKAAKAKTAEASRAVDDVNSAFLQVPHYQYRYAVDHDPGQHRQDFGAWRASFHSSLAYHAELPELYDRAARNEQALTTLHARRCLLSLLHLLKDQLRAESGATVMGAPLSTAGSPQASRQASPMPSPKSSPHHRPSASQASPIPSLRSLRPASPAAAALQTSPSPSPVLKPSSLAAPPSPLHPAVGRRNGASPTNGSSSTHSSTHSLASFGPAGFLARFVALLCSAPHQLTIPHAASQLDGLSGGGGKAGLANLGEIVHTILLAERQRLEKESGRSPFLSQREFGECCPIARHLLQTAVQLMMRLCRREASAARHSLLNTAIYIMEAFFALEDARVQQRHRRLMSIYGGEVLDPHALTSGGGSRANPMLQLIFNVPLCLLMMECIAQSQFHPSGAASSQLTAAQLVHFQAMDRQRLVFVRLLARVLTLKTKLVDEQSAHHLLAPTFFPSSAFHQPHSLSLPSQSAAALQQHVSWHRLLHARLLTIPVSMMTVVESETYSGRGAHNSEALPHTFFCHALVDLALVYDRYRSRICAFAPQLREKHSRMQEDVQRQVDEDKAEAMREEVERQAKQREELEKQGKSSPTPSAPPSSGASASDDESGDSPVLLASRRQSLTAQVAEARSRTSSLSAGQSRSPPNGLRSLTASPPLGPSPYSSQLFSSPSTPTALGSLVTPNADGSTSQISLEDLSGGPSPGSPLALALSSLPSTPDVSISFTLHSPSTALLIDSDVSVTASEAPAGPMQAVQLHEAPPEVAPPPVSASRAASLSFNLASPDHPATAAAEHEGGFALVEGEERKREESTSDDEDGEDDEGGSSAAQHRQQPSVDLAPLSEEQRERVAQRRQRRRQRDAAVFFSDIGLLEQSLAGLRGRTREKKSGHNDSRALQEELAEVDHTGIEEGDEERAEEAEDTAPRLQRSKSVEERAPMPIISTDTHSSAQTATREQRSNASGEVEKGETAEEDSQDVPVLTTFISPPSTSSSAVTVQILPTSPAPSVAESSSPSTVSSSSASPLSPSSSSFLLPEELVSSFFERVQREIFEEGRAQREEDLRRRVREVEERADADAMKSDVDAVLALAEWTCPSCTFINMASSVRCDMCEQPSTQPQPPLPVDDEPVVYFELTVLSLGVRGAIGIGLCQFGYRQHAMPGWDLGAYGWHGDDGKVFVPRTPGRPFSEPWKVGDTVGLGLWLRRREVFCTLNGVLLGSPISDVAVADYYPCVGMHSNGESAALNTGQQPFVYRGLPSSFIPRPDLTLRHPASPQQQVEVSHLSASSRMAAERWAADDQRNRMTSRTSDCNLLYGTGLLVQGWKPAPIHSRSVGYFEVRLDVSPAMRLGVGFASPDYSLNALPGWNPQSLGFHFDDGHVYDVNLFGSRRPYARAEDIHQQSVIGCGFDRKKRELFFTLDGQLLGVAADRIEDDDLYPSVGLEIQQDRVTFNFGASAFVYDGLQPSSRLSDSANRLGRHHPMVQVDEAGLVAVRVKEEGKEASEEMGGSLVQSLHPIIPKSELRVRLEEELSQHQLQLQPLSYWSQVEAKFGVEEDEALVSLLNRRCEKDESAMNLVDRPAHFSLTPEERVSFSCLSTPAISAFDLQLRLACLSKLNQLMVFVIHYTNLSRPGRRSVLARHFRDVHIRSLFLFPLKALVFRRALNNTAFLPDHSQQRPPFLLKLDLFMAQKLAQKKRLDSSGERSLFGQAYQQLQLHKHVEENKYGDHDTDPTRFFVPTDGQTRPWKVVFKGLYADDYGGLYRDSLDRMCRELQSPALSLFIPTPNAREQIGSNRHHFVPNPAARSPTELHMLRFLGRLMGAAIRTGELLFLDLPSIVWKPLVDEAVTEEDVMAIDRLSFSMVHEMRKMEQHMHSGQGGVSPEQFSDYLDCTFVVVGSDEAVHELLPGGASLPVTWSNRLHFIDALIAYRKAEFRVQCQAIKDGLCSVVPAACLTMFTWEQLRLQVCGQQVIDVQLLQANTQYEGCLPTDAHVHHFWQCMQERFSEQQKAAFLQFVNGSSRLPIRAQDFDKKFRLQRFYPSQGKADDYLPVAHTCFFSLELPAYSSSEVLYQRVLYAITHCVAIDADSTDAARASGRLTGVVDSDEED